MCEVESYPLTYHSSSAAMGGWTYPSNLDRFACSYDPQVGKVFDRNQGNDGGSTPHNESFQRMLERASPTGPDEKSGRTTFKCTHCSTYFTQKQVLARHNREKHLPGLDCLYPVCNYKWTQSRRVEYRRHLRNRHGLEDDKINEKLGLPAMRRRHKDRVTGSDLLPQFSPLSIEREQQSLAEYQQRPLALPFPVEGKDANHGFSPVMPSAAYNPQIGHAEPEVTTIKHEASGGYYQIHDRFPFPEVHPGGSTTASIPANKEMLYMPALPFPVGEYHTGQGFGDTLSPPWTDAALTSTDTSSWLAQVGVLDLYQQTMLPPGFGCTPPFVLTDSFL